jgi:hypothetical protein
MVHLLRSVVDFTIDPNRYYFDSSKSQIEEQLDNCMGNKIAAIDSDGGINYKSQGHPYDPYLTSFILGSGGHVSSWDKEKDTDAALVIRGLGGGSRKAIEHCWENSRPFYAIDTGYLGNNKSKFYHRVTKNNLQHLGPIIDRPSDRLDKIKWKFQKFTSGKKILICPPSQKVMELWNQDSPEEWTKQIIQELKKYTDRPVEVRLKPTRTQRITNQSIDRALSENVHCLVTYNSIAATEALLLGKPAIALGPNAAQVLCNTRLQDVENLTIPSKDEVEAFARHLSYCQFTQQELQNGMAWQIVNESS